MRTMNIVFHLKLWDYWHRDSRPVCFTCS